MCSEILRIEHLSRHNFSQDILRSVSFKILSGQKMALLSNPLEKQCMIDILFNGDYPDTGKIFVNGVLCEKNIPENFENGGIFYIASKTKLISNMTVARNLILSLPRLISGIWIMELSLYKKTSRLLKEYGLKDISPRDQIKDLSYCQILCLEIVIAVQRGARLIVFDDVFNQVGENGLKDINKIADLLHKKNISTLFLANRYHALFASFDALIVLQNGVTTGILKKDKITFYNFVRYYSPAISQKTSGKIVKDSVLTVKNKDLTLSVDRGDILGVWCLDGDYLMKMGKQKWKLVPLNEEYEMNVAVSVNDYKPDKIYKDMSLADNITYLANDKVSNVFGIINKRLQQHMARYSLELIHSEFLMDRYKDRKNLKEITLIDQLRVITAKWLCITPQIFLYINPFVVLDESTIQEFREILQDLTNLNISVIIMSVNRAWLDLTCDRVISIDKK